MHIKLLHKVLNFMLNHIEFNYLLTQKILRFENSAN